ncbi:biotin--[acetyl-CoA-carboxylase] ligase [Prolixibacteraceae bacterium Z1-6]|uniref:Biotin--[acetyl-CoA-carboxylase] ligase n=1 Tax=Draconibacterium aestuarii TaxID=2998507 RepID=A0A9X3F4L2_9BACT|nr:biotin--[acetyl-CoA-carboxylase] ligase [Prolixibacteraceae bacterium Z1-6]
MFLTDKNIIVLNEVDSTNNYAKQLIADKAGEGTVVLAHYQNSGKGQQGNFWESEAGKNLLFSLILYPGFLDAAKQFYISKAVSLALVQVVKKEISDVHIKWPNDIYVGNKKIGGILIENTIKGSKLDSAIIGIGLNLNQENFISGAPNPVSLKQLTGKEYNAKEVLKDFLIRFNDLMGELQNGFFETIEKNYLAGLFRYNEWSLFRKDGKEFTARIAGIGEFGQLQLEKRSGDVEAFLFKEVEFVI